MHIVIYGIIVLFEVISIGRQICFGIQYFFEKYNGTTERERAAMFTFILAPLGKDYLYLSGWALEK